MLSPRSPEVVFHELYRQINPNLGCPVTWASMITHHGELRQFFSQQDFPGPGMLSTTDMPFIGPSLFDNNRVLDTTVSSLTAASTPLVDSLRGSLLQFGIKAYVLLYEAEVAGNIYPFVAYLSRRPEKTRLSQETTDDFNNLSELSEQFSQKLTSEAQDIYKVAKPIALGTTVYRGYKYPFFTMPLIPYGELCTQFVGIEGRKGQFIKKFPFIMYSVPFNTQMDQDTQIQAEAALDVATSYNLGQRNPDLKKLPQAQILQRIRNDVLRGNCLTYIISGGKFPKEHRINAGDWMGVITPAGLQLALVTIRGGWHSLDESSFYRRLITQEELAPQLRVFFKPFEDLSEPEFKEIMNEARALII